MSLVNPERQYAVNYEISREPAKNTPPSSAPTGKSGDKSEAQKVLLDDPVTLRAALGLSEDKPKVSLKDFQSSVGQDSAYLEATLRNKIAEYGLKPSTKIELAKDAQGQIVASANAPQAILGQISQDLNNNSEFRAAFQRLSLNQPTLDYVANVSKLNNAYGSKNNLFSSLVSQQADNNSLMDIANRFNKLRETYSSDPLASLLQTTADPSYRFTVNA